MAHHISSQQVTALKKQLLEMRDRFQSERNDNRQEMESGTEEGRPGEIADYDPNDPADEAGNLYDRYEEKATIENEDRILTKVNRALQKIEEGTYGLSDVDGTPIPLARLQALPYALATVEQEEMGY